MLADSNRNHSSEVNYNNNFNSYNNHNPYYNPYGEKAYMGGDNPGMVMVTYTLDGKKCFSQWDGDLDRNYIINALKARGATDISFRKM